MAKSELTQAQKDSTALSVSNSNLDSDTKDLLTTLVNEASVIEGSTVYELGTGNFSSNMQQVYNYASKNGIKEIDSLKKEALNGQSNKETDSIDSPSGNGGIGGF